MMLILMCMTCFDLLIPLCSARDDLSQQHGCAREQMYPLMRAGRSLGCGRGSTEHGSHMEPFKTNDDQLI